MPIFIGYHVMAVDTFDDYLNKLRHCQSESVSEPAKESSNSVNNIYSSLISYFSDSNLNPDTNKVGQLILSAYSIDNFYRNHTSIKKYDIQEYNIYFYNKMCEQLSEKMSPENIASLIFDLLDPSLSRPPEACRFVVNSLQQMIYGYLNSDVGEYSQRRKDCADALAKKRARIKSLNNGSEDTLFECAAKVLPKVAFSLYITFFQGEGIKSRFTENAIMLGLEIGSIPSAYNIALKYEANESWWLEKEYHVNSKKLNLIELIVHILFDYNKHNSTIDLLFRSYKPGRALGGRNKFYFYQYSIDCYESVMKFCILSIDKRPKLLTEAGIAYLNALRFFYSEYLGVKKHSDKHKVLSEEDNSENVLAKNFIEPIDQEISARNASLITENSPRSMGLLGFPGFGGIAAGITLGAISIIPFAGVIAITGVGLALAGLAIVRALSPVWSKGGYDTGAKIISTHGGKGISADNFVSQSRVTANSRGSGQVLKTQEIDTPLPSLKQR